MRNWLERGAGTTDDAPAGAAAGPAATPVQVPVPARPPAQPRYLDGYPASTQLSDGGRAELFDPALKHYVAAYRTGDPHFAEESDRQRWYAARASVLGQMLRLIEGSRWRERLVLRGSVLLQAYLGEGARAPGDIDWVVLPNELAADAPEARQMLQELADLLTRRHTIGPVRIHFDRVAHDDIWTYERAEGRRMTIVWSLDDLPEGQVQFDFVFREPLAQAPVPVEIPLTAGETVSLLGATPELSLAWKLVWLQTDMYPQGKDLYDAVLLAERSQMPLSLFVAAMRSCEDYRDWDEQALPDIADWQIDWDNFRAEYPWVQGEAEDWKRRLSAQLVLTRR